MSTTLRRPSHNDDLRVLTPELLHDLRSPLNLIIGYSEMLIAEANNDGPQSFIPDLRKVHTAGWRLLSLLSEGDDSLSASLRPVSRATAVGQIFAISTDDNAAELDQAPAEAHILVVDDNEQNREVLCQRLNRQGHRVSTAENGRQALELACAQTFDIVLLDIVMPAR
ncbi:response regulator [bacterium]|nr:MAG: response regulator [bacterium]